MGKTLAVVSKSKECYSEISLSASPDSIGFPYKQNVK
jgi:hypothetical protein